MFISRIGRNELHPLQGIDTTYDLMLLPWKFHRRNELHPLQGIDTKLLLQQPQCGHFVEMNFTRYRVLTHPTIAFFNFNSFVEMNFTRYRVLTH